MPTYEYACRDCGQHLEVVQSFKDEPLTQCPSCEGSLRKVFSAAGIVFKGSGWHIKDYGTSGSSSSGGSAETSSSSSSTSEPKTDSSPGSSSAEKKSA